MSQLRFFAALGGDHPNALFFAGDLGQRIFQQPFSWKSLGVDVRGRSRTLRVNYRTSHQIREQADRRLWSEIADVDGNVETRRETVSVFNGPPPVVCVCATADEETAAVAAWVKERLANGVQVHEIGMSVRASEQLDRAQAAAKAAGVRRWCADAGRPTRFKPSSPSPTDAVRDGSAKLGHPVQNVTREHGLTPLPR